MDKASVAWHGLTASLEAVVREWVPGNLSAESKYRDSLVLHLRKCAPGALIEKEYRVIGTTVVRCGNWCWQMLSCVGPA
jgi:hypothetical protein